MANNALELPQDVVTGFILQVVEDIIVAHDFLMCPFVHRAKEVNSFLVSLHLVQMIIDELNDTEATPLPISLSLAQK